MYGFVKEKSENTHISSCEVLKVRISIILIFRQCLKNIIYNIMVIRLDYVFLQLMKKEFGVAKIVELKYGNCSFEKIVKMTEKMEL